IIASDSVSGKPGTAHKTFEQLVQRSGVRRVRFHDLRHTCASLLLAQGVSPRVVMDVLGHSQLSITMDLYARFVETPRPPRPSL
ncbi:MAG: tyrosine-type recombinase/integrase, partial [Propionibacteriaceae bacterium]